MTVLVLTDQFDPTADRVVDILNKRGVPVFRCDTADFPQRLAMSATLDRAGDWTGQLTGEHGDLNLADVRSIWYRRPTEYALPDGLSEPERQSAAAEARFGLGGVLSSLPALWINHPGREADASYKPTQLAVAARCGLQTPHTIITNQPDAVRTFAWQIAGPLVCKMLGASAFIEDHTPKIVYTARLTDRDLADLRGVQTTAHLFQEYVEKKYEARVTVVGGSCLTAAIHAGSAESEVDWRTDYDSLRYEAVELPERVRTGIMAFMRWFGLVFGAFDFVVRPDETWVMLECNPAGQFGWLESAADLPISETLASLLAEGTNAI